MKYLSPMMLLVVALAARRHVTHGFAVVGGGSGACSRQQHIVTRLSNNKQQQALMKVRGGGGSSSRLFGGGGITEAWDAYNTALEANPLFIKSVTASVILGCADLAGQAIEKINSGGDDATNITGQGVDLARAARFAIFGLVLQAPWNHFYYNLLDGQIPPTQEPFSGTNILKVGIDQFIQAPIFTVLIFAFLGALEGKGLESIQKQLKEDYPETIVANWKLWVPATIINIGFVPPILRVLYLNCVFFFWSIYLSLVINKQES